MRSVTNSRERIDGQTIGQFNVVRPLNEGESAKIYEVEWQGNHYALKLSRFVDDNGHILNRFRAEATILQQVDHPFVVSALFVGSHNRHPYTIMELLHGDLLGASIEKGPISEAQAVRIGANLAAALLAVHRLGIVHRDIHPNNLFWDDAKNEIKLIDFGLSVAESKEVTSQTVGTVLYLSPEQSGALQRAVDRRSDLYSVGAVLFHCLAGKPPFGGDDVAQIIQQHINSVPPSLESLRKGVSPEFSRIVARLLQKDPDDRYQSALELLVDLEKVKDPSFKLSAWTQAVQKKSKLIGREVETDQLLSVWRKTLAGQGSVVLLEGDPGAGKSRLAKDTIEMAKQDGAFAIVGKCVSGSLLELIRQLLKSLAGVSQDNANLIAAITPFLSKNLGPCSVIGPELLSLCGLAPIAAVAEQEVSFEDFAELFNAASDVGPLVLFVDDIQWIDEASRELLLQVVAGSRSSRILVLATARDDESGKEKLQLFKDIYADYLSAEIKIGALSQTDTGRLATHLLGLPAPDELIEFAFRITSGNPFAVEECIRSIVHHGVLAPNWGKWEIDHARLEALKLPDNIVDLVRVRMSSLSPFSKLTLAAAACVGHQFTPVALTNIVGRSRYEVDEALAIAEQNSFVARAGGGSWRFIHDRVMEAALTLLPSEEISTLHRRLRDVLMDDALSGKATWSAVARHQKESHDESAPQTVAQIYANAATESFVSLALDDSYQYYQALERVESRHGLKTLADPLNFAMVCARIGKKTEATRKFKMALDQSTHPTYRAMVFGLMSRNHVENLETTDGLAAIQCGFRELNMKVPTVRRSFVLSVLSAALSEIMYRTRIGYASCPTIKKDRYEAIVSLHEQLAFLKFFEVDPVSGMVALFKAMPYGVRLGPSRPLSMLYSTIAIFLGIFRTRGAMEVCTARALRMARQLNDPQLVAGIKAYHAFGVNYTGADREAEERYYRLLVDQKEVMSAENFVYVCGALMALTLDGGHTQETLRIALAGISHLNLKSPGERQRDHYLTWCYSFAMSSLVSLGRVSEAQQYKDKLDAYFNEHPNDRFHWGVHLMNLMHLLAEQNEEGPVVENLIQKHDELKLFIPTAIMQLRHFYISKAHLRFEHWRSAKNPQENRRRAALFRASMRQLRQCCQTDLFRSHYFALKGAAAVQNRRYGAASRYLEKAELYSNQVNNYTGMFKIGLTKARQYQQRGYAKMAMEQAQNLLVFCRRHGWAFRAKQVAAEFGLRTGDESETSPSSNSNNSYRGNASAALALALAQKSREALIRMSIAASESIEPRAQINSALTEILAILGGERAALLLQSHNREGLEFYAGRNSQGSTFEKLEGYSTTVVDRAWIEQKPIVVGSSGEGALKSTQSMIANDLRSIIAAPVTVKGKKIGVVYLDSSLLKGMFTASDVDLLGSIATQMGIGLESARSAAMEIEKNAMERDLELSGTAQKMLLPSARTSQSDAFELVTSYQPANRAGGDWFWYEHLDSNRLRVFLADVTGHGPGPAIMTGVLAGVHQALQDQSLPLLQWVEKLGHAVHIIGHGELWMAFTALEFDAEREVLQIVNAGGAEIGILPANADRAEDVSTPGDPLGMMPMRLGHQEIPFREGSRAILCTDGAYEFSVKGKQFGRRRLLKQFSAGRNDSLKDALARIDRVSTDLSGGVYDDDRTLLLIGRKRRV